MLLFVLLSCVPLCLSQMTFDKDEMLSWCLKGNFHKSKPSYEQRLYNQCLPWKKRACCTYNTTENLHRRDRWHHNFNLDHCGRMSDKCRWHFIQDLCFYECSPNIGPWVVKVDMKITRERFHKVPLCRQHCESWFDACKDDFTCSDNWVRHFLWDKNGNKCLPGKKCSTFLDVYTNSTNFCQQVWDDAWLVTNDNEPCMKLWFDEDKINPNDYVALHKSHELLSSRSHLNRPSLFLFLIVMVISKFIFSREY